MSSKAQSKEKFKSKIGGQAVIEGVMMRGIHKAAMACRLPDGTIILADEISPDTCRLWDKDTNEKLDKDRFRRDLGNVEDAYQEVMGRLLAKSAEK